VPEPASITRARLEEIRLADGDRSSEVTDTEATVDVQFNPESLKVTYSNTVAGGDQSGGSAIQYVSKSSTKLSVTLWFDASAKEGVADVRELTKPVNHFFIPVQQGEGMAPPAVRFLWGSFLFEGVMDSMDETLEYFSADGRPLRAQVALSITSQDIQSKIARLAGAGGAAAPGTRPQVPATEGEGLQQMLGRTGDPAGWMAVASANGIENPRMLAPGTSVDLAAGRSASASVSVTVRR
jgi:hypothetical protein